MIDFFDEDEDDFLEEDEYYDDDDYDDYGEYLDDTYDYQIAQPKRARHRKCCILTRLEEV